MESFVSNMSIQSFDAVHNMIGLACGSSILDQIVSNFDNSNSGLLLYLMP